MGILTRRAFVIALAGLIGAGAVGLFSPNATVFVLGILALGAGLILGILHYLLRPVPGEPLVDLPSFPTAPLPTPSQKAVVRQRREQPSADIIAFPRAPK